jgi:ribose 5-phosphate isomerase B
MRVGMATDPGGFSLKEDLVAHLREAGHEVVDFGAFSRGSLPSSLVWHRATCDAWEK